MPPESTTVMDDGKACRWRSVSTSLFGDPRGVLSSDGWMDGWADEPKEDNGRWLEGREGGKGEGRNYWTRIHPRAV